MGGQPPIWNQPNDPYEKYRVEAIEKDKIAKEQKNRPPPEEEPKKGIAFGAQLLLLFQRFIELFEEATDRGLSPTAEKEIEKNLLAFKASLDLMKREDRSQDAAFLNTMSEQWHQILDDALKFKRTSPLAIEYVTFIKAIEHYPENEEHTFGYYLMEFAGQKWLPFPYMDLIHKMYRDHEKDPHSSVMTSWTGEIDQLVKTLGA